LGGGTTDADAVVEVGEGRPCDSCDSFRPFSPSGDVIVWVSCTVGLATCDVERATLTGTVWSVSRIANDIHSVEWARTDGQWITYPRSGVDPFSTDICWQPVAGGVEQCLELPGTQAYPTVAGGVIVFSGVQPGQSDFDIFAYQISTNRMFQSPRRRVENS